MNKNIEREIERIIAERDFGGWTKENAAAFERRRQAWLADCDRRAALKEAVKKSRYKRRNVRR